MGIHARVSSSFLAAVLTVAGACGGDAPQAGGDSAGGAGGAVASACDASARLDGDRIGPLRVGMQMRQLPPSCAARDTTFSLNADMPETGFVVDMGNSSAVAVTTGSADSTVSRIIVTRPGLSTRAGIGVGSTMAELRQKYGRICGEIGNGLVGIRADSVPGAVFAISRDFATLKTQEPLVRRDAAPVSDSARVESVWVLGGQPRCDG